MVNRNFYSEEELQGRRYSSRTQRYPSSQPERELPSAPAMHQYSSHREQSSASHDSEGSEQSQEQEANLNPRRRIPVACGRCRKRKIRCSGDPGNGQPCTNCKSAGSDLCQFLRVSSTEAQMKFDTPDFCYETLSRLPSRGLSLGPQQYSQQSPLSSDSFSYRTNSLSAYSYPIKGYYGMQTYPDFVDENVNVDYLEGSPALQGYPLLSSEHLGVLPSYSTPFNARNWANNSQMTKQTVFLEQDSTYNQGQPSYPAAGGMPRHHISAEPKIPSANGLSAYSASSVLNDRVLPLPGTSRTAGSFARSGDNVLPSSQVGYFPSYSSMNTNYIRGINNNAVSDTGPVSASYPPSLSLSNSSPESTPSQTTSQHLPGQQQVYTPNNGDGFSSLREGAPSPGAYSHGQRSERGSHSNHDQTDSLHTNGDLSNGQDYIPYISRNYPIPPMDPGLHSIPPRRFRACKLLLDER